VVVVEAGIQKGIPSWSGEKVLPNRVLHSGDGYRPGSKTQHKKTHLVRFRNICRAVVVGAMRFRI
jgi:hypothetical protein